MNREINTNPHPRADAIWPNGSRSGEGYEEFCRLEAALRDLLTTVRDLMATVEAARAILDRGRK